MPEPLEHDALTPVLSVAADDPDGEVRVAALDAAAHFPLDLPGWNAIAQSNWRIVQAEPPGSPARRAALALAVRLPLRSLREHLRRMVQDEHEADRDTLLQALDAAGDPSRIRALLEEAHQPEGAGRLGWLAAMPVEDEIDASELLPPPQGNSTAQFWHALVAARLGDFGPIDAVFSGEAGEPDLFWGSPWTAYDAIARIRPVPEPMREHLLAALARLETAPMPSQSSQIERMVQLTVWAATGVADAEGRPLTEPAPPWPDRPPPTPSPQQVAEARRVRTKLPVALFEQGLQQADWQALGWLPPVDVAGLVRDVVAEGNKRSLKLIDTSEPVWPMGNEIVSLAGACPPTAHWPTAELVAEQLRAPQPALDDGQLAWMLSRDDNTRLIGTLAGMVTPDREASERLRILRLLGAAADVQSGRGGSPMRGAGPGSVLLTGHVELLDDRPRTGARRLAEPDAAPPGPEQRKVNAVILSGGAQRKSFVAGADNTIRCWIGLPTPDAASANDTVPPLNIPPEGLPLEVQLAWRDSSGAQHSDSQPMLLPAGRTARSGDCDLQLHVPADEPYVAAEIAFRYKGRVFEMVQLGASALAAGEAEGQRQQIKITVQTSQRQVIELADSRQVHDVFVFGDAGSASSGLLQFGATGGRRFELADVEKSIEWIATELHATQTLVVRRQAAQVQRHLMGAAAPPAADELDAGNADVLKLLRNMARHGAGLYQRLVEQKGFTDPGERIQLVNLNPDTYAPLEFVYDGGYPVSTAPLCAAGIEALKSGADTCPHCTLPAPAATRDAAACVCPFGFWSLRKIIERVTPGEIDQASVPGAGRRSLPVIDSVAFASSHLVPQEEREATQDALQKSFAGCYLAEDWPQWKAAVEHHPPLLVVLPHHGVQGNLDYLEIGAEALSEDVGKLSFGQIGPQYINPGVRDPGPIVLMLGCQTGAKSETGYVQMTLRVQQQHASIVLGTLAEVLGRHAAPVARAIVAELVAVDDPGADFGTLMRRVRRRMLARGYLMALCLVALGDAEWRLTPRTEPTHADP